MIKFILKVVVVYLILQYGFKVDINGYVKPYLEPLWQDAQQSLPEQADKLLEKAKPLSQALTESDLANLVKDRANAINDASDNAEALEEKMKQLKEAAGKALEDKN